VTPKLVSEDSQSLENRKKKKTPRMSILVTEEFVKIPMIFVLPDLLPRSPQHPELSSVFRVEGVGKHAEFLDAVAEKADGRQVCELIIAVRRPSGEIVSRPRPPVHADDAGAHSLTRCPTPCFPLVPRFWHTPITVILSRCVRGAFRARPALRNDEPNCVESWSTSGGLSP